MERPIFRHKRQWNAPPVAFGSNPFYYADGFNNASADKKEAKLACGGMRPLFNGKGQRDEWDACAAALKDKKIELEVENTKAIIADATAAPARAAAAEALAIAEAEKTKRALSPMAIAGIAFGGLIIVGTIVLVAMKVSK